MALHVQVCLLSGRRVEVEASPDSTVQQLKLRAQDELGVPVSALVDKKSGRLLGPGEILGTLEEPCNIFALVRHAALCSTHRNFALLRADGSVACWGLPHGVPDSTVQGQLQDVREIQGSGSAFAAIRCDGSVVTWGNPSQGGDSREVQAQLRNVRSVCATNGAFAALLDGGTVVTWGDEDCGGDSRAVQSQLRDVQQIQPARQDFAALLGNGSVARLADRRCSSYPRSHRLPHPYSELPNF